MEKVIIIGAGGLAKLVVDILKKDSRYSLEGLIDVEVSDKKIAGLKAIGRDSDLADIFKSGIRKAAFAIGCVSIETNRARSRQYEIVKNIGFEMVNVAQKESYVSETASLGEGNIIIGNCYIGPDVKIGSGTIIHPFSSINHDSVIGDYVQLSQGVKIAGGVKVGKLSFLGMGSSIVQGQVVPDESFIKSQTVYYKEVK